ncbi:MAG TPA: ABC transporter permease [Gemmatimonadaceae bacterium]|nr:ABC transporter permease [Gemmatimonadaceae bacterium]
MSRRLFRLPWRTRRQIGDDVDEELRFHIDMRVDELHALGLTPDAARAEAMRQFGDIDDARHYITAVDRATEAAHRRSEYMGDLRQDLVYAVRKLRSAPAFTLTVVLTLALGIGANTAIFSVVDGVLLRPLPFREPDRVMRVRFIYNGSPDAGSPPELNDFRTRNRTMQSLAMYAGQSVNLVRDGADPELLVGVEVSANWFNILGVTPQLGRSFVEGEDHEGAPKVAMLSDAVWRRDFNANPDVVGRAVNLNGEQVTIVGVMPAGRGYPFSAEVWVPMVFTARQLSDAYRGARYTQMIGRLKDGVSVEEAEHDLSQIGAGIARAFPENYKTLAMQPLPLQSAVVGDLRRPLWVVMGAVAFVLLIACANVANLFLVRATNRESEMAVRTALGAGRSRLVRQLVTESVLLSLIGGGAGLLLASSGMRMLLRLAPDNLPRVGDATIDATALGVTIFIALATGLAFGLLPALQMDGDVASALRAGTRGTRTSHASARARGGIVVTEVALAVTLLVGAGLLLRSFQRLIAVDPGFRPESVLSFRVSLPDRSYASDTAQRNFVNALDERLRALPGVRQVGIASALPMDGSDFTLSFTVRGRAPVPVNDEPATQIVAATPEFFSAIGIPVLRGRAYTRDAQPGTPKEVVVSREFVRRHFPGEDPLGRYIELGWSRNGDRRGGTIIGVVGDVKQGALDQETPPLLYLPHAQAPLGNLRIVLRTAVPPSSLTKPVHAAVRDLDRELPVFAVRPLQEYVDASVGPQRFYATLVALFALVALALAAVGLYGVIAYAVSQRTHELGVRVALGATGTRIASMVVRQGLGLTLGGVLCGIVAALLVTRVLQSLLFGVSAMDPLTFVVVLVLLVAVATLASYIPARRAARVDPLIAMRGE